MTGRMILLRGVAGAGKTTLAKRLEANGAVHMCPDEWLVAMGYDIYDPAARTGVLPDRTRTDLRPTRAIAQRPAASRTRQV